MNYTKWLLVKFAVLLLVVVGCFAVEQYFFTVQQPQATLQMTLDQMDGRTTPEMLRATDMAKNYFWCGLIVVPIALCLFLSDVVLLIKKLSK